MRYTPTVILSSGSAAGTVVSSGVCLSNVYVYSMHLLFGGGGTGSVIIYGSNDPVPLASSGTNPAANVVNWNPVAAGTVAVTGTGATSALVNFDGVGYFWVRAVYVASGGTTSMAINYFGKGV